MPQDRTATPEEVLMFRQASENRNLNAGMMGWYVEIPPEVDLDRLAGAIQAAVAGSTEFSVQFVGDLQNLRRQDGPPPTYELVRLNGSSDEELRAFAQRVAGQTLDAFSGPTIHAVLLRNDRGAWLAIAINHLLVDGDGFELFLSRVEKAYSGAPQSRVAELDWSNQGSAGGYDDSRGPLPCASFFRIGDADLNVKVRRLDELANTFHASRFTVTLAFWADVVCRAAKSDRLRIAVPIATRAITEDEAGVGNWSWIPTLKFEQAGSAQERVQTVKRSLAEAFTHYESDARRLAGEMDTTLADMEFAWFIDMPALKLGAIELSSKQVSPTSLKAPLMSWAELDGADLAFRCFAADPAGGHAVSASRDSLRDAAVATWREWEEETVR